MGCTLNIDPGSCRDILDWTSCDLLTQRSWQQNLCTWCENCDSKTLYLRSCWAIWGRISFANRNTSSWLVRVASRVYRIYSSLAAAAQEALNPKQRNQRKRAQRLIRCRRWNLSEFAAGRTKTHPRNLRRQILCPEVTPRVSPHRSAVTLTMAAQHLREDVWVRINWGREGKDATTVVWSCGVPMMIWTRASLVVILAGRTSVSDAKVAVQGTVLSHECFWIRVLFI